MFIQTWEQSWYINTDNNKIGNKHVLMSFSGSTSAGFKVPKSNQDNAGEK